jgi:hypothetical protein
MPIWAANKQMHIRAAAPVPSVLLRASNCSRVGNANSLIAISPSISHFCS